MRLALTKGYVAVVDKQDYTRVKAAGPWHVRLSKRRRVVYAGRGLRKGDKTTQILLHRFILKLTNPKVLVDHKDGNGLNNKRKNLRVVTPSESQHNLGLFKNSSSGITGVSWDKRKETWRAYVTLNYTQIFLGHFDTLKKAAKAAKEGRKIHHNSFARGRKKTP